MLLAFFDESGHSSNSDFVGMAGLVAPEKNWAVFERKWKKALAKAHLSHFHMKDFAHSVREFKEWKGKEIRRRELLATLIKIIEEANAMPMGTIFNVNDYKNCDSAAAEIDPYYQCLLDSCYGAAVYSLGQERVRIVFSDNNEFKGKVPQIFSAIQSQMKFGNRLEQFEFQDMRTRGALQAADIVAYEYSKYCNDKIKRPSCDARWTMKKLINLGRTIQKVEWFKYWDKETFQFLNNTENLSSGINN